MLLQSRLTVNGKSYNDTRFFVLLKIGKNEFAINETGIGEEHENVVELASKFDFFQSVQKVEVYMFAPRVLVLHSGGKFILLKKMMI